MSCFLWDPKSDLDQAFLRLASEVPEIATQVTSLTKAAGKWKTLPEGWTQDSVRKFWDSLTGEAKHKVTRCMNRMNGKVDDTGAFCASLADKMTPGWRKRQATRRSLLTSADRQKLPPLQSQENEKDPIVWVKLFNPYGFGTWFIIEFDGFDTFYGLVKLRGSSKLDYFSLSELENTKACIGRKMHPDIPGIERDAWFHPMPLSRAKEAMLINQIVQLYHNKKKVV